MSEVRRRLEPAFGGEPSAERFRLTGWRVVCVVGGEDVRSTTPLFALPRLRFVRDVGMLSSESAEGLRMSSMSMPSLCPKRE